MKTDEENKKGRKGKYSVKEQYEVVINYLEIKPCMYSEIKIFDLQKYASQNRLRELYKAGVIKINKIEIEGKSRIRVYELSENYREQLNTFLNTKTDTTTSLDKEIEMYRKAFETQELFNNCRRTFLAKHPFDELKNTFAFAY